MKRKKCSHLPPRVFIIGRDKEEEEEEDKEEGKKMYTAGTKHLEEKERAYVNAMEQFRTRAMDRDRLTEVGKEYEEEVEKFEKENDSK